jgi:glycolate oxidase FAD binding subunit
VGAGTKPPLSAAPADAATLDLSGLRGVLDYEPSEFTVTALAGTPLVEISAVLGEHRQYLPCDPPFAARGATLGGAVASGISGSGRQRYGGLRDFLIGVAMVGGDGVLVRGGGRVVKNAAGFDLPKLMVGSLGTLGVLVELTFKVFPRPESTRTLRVAAGDFAQAHRIVLGLAAAPLDLDALDLEPGGCEPGACEPGSSWQVLARIGGAVDSLAARTRRIEGFLGADRRQVVAEAIGGPAEEELWSDVGEAAWLPPGHRLVRVPIAPSRAASVEDAIASAASGAGHDPPRRYVAGCSVLWLAWAPERPLSELGRLLARQQLAGQVVVGEASAPLIGELPGLPFYRRLKRALDPEERFRDLAELRPAHGELEARA